MKYFLKTESINNIKTLALLHTWKPIADSICYCQLLYHQTDSNSAEHYLGFQVLKIAFFGTLGAPVNKEMS